MLLKGKEIFSRENAHSKQIPTATVGPSKPRILRARTGYPVVFGGIWSRTRALRSEARLHNYCPPHNQTNKQNRNRSTFDHSVSHRTANPLQTNHLFTKSVSCNCLQFRKICSNIYRELNISFKMSIFWTFYPFNWKGFNQNKQNFQKI